MEIKIKRILVVEEENNLGTIWVERLIERCLLEELSLPPELQGRYLRSKHMKKSHNDVSL